MADIRLGKEYQLYDLVVGTFWLLKGGLKVCPSEQLSNIHDFFNGHWPSFKLGGAGDLSNQIFVSGHSQTW